MSTLTSATSTPQPCPPPPPPPQPPPPPPPAPAPAPAPPPRRNPLPFEARQPFFYSLRLARGPRCRLMHELCKEGSQRKQARCAMRGRCHAL
eukprot:1315049-Alexandrium_andersonii.AAC.1